MEKELKIKFSQIAFEDLSEIERQLFEASKKPEKMLTLRTLISM
jgi:hypothetical protein